jgi:hypothetical protein
MHQGGSPTTRLTLRKTGNLLRGHLKLLRKPPKKKKRTDITITARLGMMEIREKLGVQNNVLKTHTNDSGYNT